MIFAHIANSCRKQTPPCRARAETWTYFHLFSTLNLCVSHGLSRHGLFSQQGEFLALWRAWRTLQKVVTSWPSTCLAQETCCDFSFISAGSKGSVGKRRLCTQRRTLQESRFCLLSHVDAALAVLQPSSIRAVTLCLLWKPRCWFSFSKQEKAWFHCFGFINSELEKSFSQL